MARISRRAEPFARKAVQGILATWHRTWPLPVSAHNPMLASDHRSHCELAAAALYSYSWPPPIHSRSAKKTTACRGACSGSPQTPNEDTARQGSIPRTHRFSSETGDGAIARRREHLPDGFHSRQNPSVLSSLISGAWPVRARHHP